MGYKKGARTAKVRKKELWLQKRRDTKRILSLMSSDTWYRPRDLAVHLSLNLDTIRQKLSDYHKKGIVEKRYNALGMMKGREVLFKRI